MIQVSCSECLGEKSIFNGTDFDICPRCKGDGSIFIEEESDYLDEDEDYIEGNDSLKYPSEWEQYDENQHFREEDSL